MKSAALNYDRGPDCHERSSQAAQEAPSGANVYFLKDVTNSPASERAISSLPQELLALILDMAHEGASDDDPDSFPKFSIYIAASQVSKTWRLFALDNPLWWSRILISPPWKFEAIATYLKRSKECPIDMHISVHADRKSVV